MADLDTAAKRYSMMGLDLPWPVLLPEPTGVIGSGPNQHWLRKYAGILWNAATNTAYGIEDLTTMVSFYLADTLIGLPGYLSEDYRAYLDAVRGTTGKNDLNTAQYLDLKV